MKKRQIIGDRDVFIKDIGNEVVVEVSWLALASVPKEGWVGGIPDGDWVVYAMKSRTEGIVITETNPILNDDTENVQALKVLDELCEHEYNKIRLAWDKSMRWFGPSFKVKDE